MHRGVNVVAFYSCAIRRRQRREEIVEEWIPPSRIFFALATPHEFQMSHGGTAANSDGQINLMVGREFAGRKKKRVIDASERAKILCVPFQEYTGLPYDFVISKRGCLLTPFEHGSFDRDSRERDVDPDWYGMPNIDFKQPRQLANQRANNREKKMRRGGEGTRIITLSDRKLI